MKYIYCMFPSCCCFSRGFFFFFWSWHALLGCHGAMRGFNPTVPQTIWIMKESDKDNGWASPSQHCHDPKFIHPPSHRRDTSSNSAGFLRRLILKWLLLMVKYSRWIEQAAGTKNMTVTLACRVLSKFTFSFIHFPSSPSLHVVDSY